jgi:hypothetical protein
MQALRLWLYHMVDVQLWMGCAAIQHAFTPASRLRLLDVLHSAVRPGMATED